jgi:hypothetical protein
LFIADRSDEGLAEIRQAHQINPNCAITQSFLGVYEATYGDEARGVFHTMEAVRLSPRDLLRATFLGAVAFAHFAACDYVAAVEAATTALYESPGAAAAHVVRTMSWVGTGDITRAKSEFQELRRMAPALVEARLGEKWLSSHPRCMKRAQVFLRIAAGLEEPGDG